MFDIELIYPNQDKCGECGCDFGVHLVTCSHFYVCEECRSHKRGYHFKGCSRRARQVFLDCDGVLADFDGAGKELWGMAPREYEALVGEERFWRDLEKHSNFFGHLQLMPGARELVAGCEAITHHKPIILTGCPRGDWATQQKIAWGKQHFPELPMITCKSRHKRDHAQPGDILIDDRTKYAHLWKEMGGIFILHTDADSSLSQLSRAW